MSKKINYTKGQIINGLIFIKEAERAKCSNRRALFQCYCRKEFITAIGNVRNGRTNSCGCFHKKQAKIKNTTHGMAKHPLYKVWAAMKDRCLNINNKRYDDYGGRGIDICIEWVKGFEPFYKWAMKNYYQKGLTIERIDNDKGYFPKNCTFITYTEQNRNQRKTLGWVNVNMIREMKQSNSKISQRKIANIFGVTQATIWYILGNRTWKI